LGGRLSLERGSGAALSIGFAASASAGVAGIVEDAPGATLFVGGASMDARTPSSLAAHSGIIGMVVEAGSGPSVVWLIFLFFFFFIFFFFVFSSFFSSVSLEGKEEGRLGER
jgi:hypothetical protein